MALKYYYVIVLTLQLLYYTCEECTDNDFSKHDLELKLKYLHQNDKLLLRWLDSFIYKQRKLRILVSLQFSRQLDTFLDWKCHTSSKTVYPDRAQVEHYNCRRCHEEKAREYIILVNVELIGRVSCIRAYTKVAGVITMH